MLPNQYWSTLQRQQQQQQQPQQQQQRTFQYGSTINPYGVTQPYVSQPYQYGTQQQAQMQYAYGMQQQQQQLFYQQQQQYQYQQQRQQQYQYYQQQMQQRQPQTNQFVYGAATPAVSQGYVSNVKSSAPPKQEQKKAQNILGDSLDVFGSFNSVPPKAQQSKDLFGDFSSVAPKKAEPPKVEPQKTTKSLSIDDIFGSFSSGTTAKKEPQNDPFGDFNSVSPVKKPTEPEKKKIQEEENDDDPFGDFTSVKPAQRSLPEKKEQPKCDKKVSEAVQDTKKNVGKGSINWSDMTAVNNLISVFKEADMKEAEQQKKSASAQQPSLPSQPQVVTQNVGIVQQPQQFVQQQMMPTYTPFNSIVNNATGVQPQQLGGWGAFESLAPQKAVEMKKEDHPQIGDSWGDFENANVQTISNERKDEPPSGTVKQLTNDSLFDGVTSISVGLSSGPKKEELKIDDSWGDFEDANIQTVPPQLPNDVQKPKEEEKPKTEGPLEISDPWGAFEDANTQTAPHKLPEDTLKPQIEVSGNIRDPSTNTIKPLANDSLFDGVTSISVGLSSEPKKENKKEELKIDDPWGDFEDANTQTVLPKLPDDVQKPKEEEKLKAEEPSTKAIKPLTNDSLFDGVTPISVGLSSEDKKEDKKELKIDDSWGDFEDANIQTAPPQLPNNAQKPKEEEKLKAEGPPEISDSWGNFEDANTQEVPPQLPDDAPRPKIELAAQVSDPSTKTIKPLTNDSLFDGVTPISIGLSSEDKKEEPPKAEEPPQINDPWGDFEDASAPELPPQLPDDAPKPKTEELPKAEEPSQINDPWGDFEDASVPELPPQLPDDTQKPKKEDKKEEPPKAEEPPQINDPWGDFEDASVPELPPQLPDDEQKPKKEDKKEEPPKAEEPPQINDPWGDFEDASAPELPPQLPDDTPKPKTEEPLKISDSKEDFEDTTNKLPQNEEKTTPTKDTDSFIDWDMPTAVAPTAVSENYEASSAPNDDIFSLFTGNPSTASNAHKTNSVAEAVSVNLLDFSVPSSAPAHVDVSDIFGSVSESVNVKEGRSVTIDKALLVSLVEQERFEEAILCQKDLHVQRKIHLKEKEMKASGRSQTEIDTYLSAMKKKLQPDNVVNSWKLPSLTHETLEEIRNANKMCKKTKEEIGDIHKELMKLAQTSLPDALALYNKTLEELSAVAENPWEMALKSAAKEFARAISIFTSITAASPKVTKAALEHQKTRDYVEGLKVIRLKTLEIERYAKDNMLSLFLPETCRAMWENLCDVLLICGIRMSLKSECNGNGDKSYGMCFVCMAQITDSDDAKGQCHKICDRLIK